MNKFLNSYRKPLFIFWYCSFWKKYLVFYLKDVNISNRCSELHILSNKACRFDHFTILLGYLTADTVS